MIAGVWTSCVDYNYYCLYVVCDCHIELLTVTYRTMYIMDSPICVQACQSCQGLPMLVPACPNYHEAMYKEECCDWNIVLPTQVS